MKRQKQLFNRCLLHFRKYRRKLQRLKSSGKNIRRQAILELRLERLWNTLKSLDGVIKRSMVGAAIAGGLLATNAVNAQVSSTKEFAYKGVAADQLDRNVAATTDKFSLVTGTPFTGRGGSGLAFADIDGDGDQDVILVGESNGGGTDLFKNDGNGSFTLVTGTNFPTLRDASTGFADVDKDGDVDLLIGGMGLKEFNYDRIAQLYTNDGSGNFTLVNGTPFEKATSVRVAFADIDNDGDQDVIGSKVVDYVAYHVAYKNDGSGNFGAGTNITTGAYSSDGFAFADIDGDGDQDFIHPQNLFFNDGTGVFTKVSFQSAIGDALSTIGVADIDGDGDLDLLGEGRDSGTPASLLINDGSGSFTKATGTPFKDVYGGDIDFADVDNDGDMDVLITGSDPFSHDIIDLPTHADLFLNDGKGNFTLENATPFPNSARESDNEFADIDKDGDMDLLMSESGQLFLNNKFTAPTVTISTTTKNPNNLSPIPVLVNFSKEVNGFSLSDITVGNGTASNMTTTDNVVFAMDITPTADGAVTLDIAAGVVKDQDGVDNRAATQLSVVSDRTAPTVQVASSDSPVTNKSSFGATITFNEEINGFSLSDIMVGNGTASNMTTSDSTVFALEVTPVSDGAVTIDIAKDVVTDEAGNTNAASTQFSTTSDRTAPVPTLATTTTNPTNDNPITAKVTFTEEINGFSLSDITVGNGTAGSLTTSDSTVFELAITPTADGAVTMDIAANAVTDQAGNGNSVATQLSVVSDRTAPTIAVASSATDPTETSPIPITVTFSEEINGFSLSDITVGNGTADKLTTSDSTKFALEIVPTADGAVTVDIAKDLVTDQAGNGNTVASQFSIAYAMPDPFTWTGATNNDWVTASNWFGGVLPGKSDSPIIPDVTNDPIVNAGTNVTIDNIELGAGSGLKVSSGSSLAIMGAASGTGSVTVERNTADNFGQSAISSPVTQAMFQNLGADVIKVYDEVANAFVDVTSGPLQSGEGTLVSFNNADPTVVFTGTPNSGTITTPLSNQGNKENGIEDGFNLVGNPYMAAINRPAFVAANSTLIDGNVWLYAEGSVGGDYITVNDLGVSGLSASAVTMYDLTNDAINSVQGFLVKAQSGANGQMLTFNPDMQLDAGNGDDTFFRTRGSNEDRDIIKLSLSGQGDQAGIYNEIIIGLDEDATTGDDLGLDALKFSGNDLISFYSVQGGKKYAIQALPKDESASIDVMLGFSLMQAGTYMINVEKLESTNDDLKISLMDQVTGETTDLDAVGKSITFSISETITAEDRFMVSFPSTTVTSIDDPSFDQLSIVSGNSSGLTVKYLAGNQHVGIYDLTGKVVLIDSFDFDNGLARINTQLNPNQIYLLKIRDEIVKFIIK